MDTLTALDQSIYAETELSNLFAYFATAFYDKPAAQAFWEELARVEAEHSKLLNFEKWRLARGATDSNLVRYDDPALLKQMQKFDDYRSDLALPAELPVACKIAIRAERSALTFHNDRIFIVDFGVTDQALEKLVGDEEVHLEVLAEIANSDDPLKTLEDFDPARLSAGKSEQ